MLPTPELVEVVELPQPPATAETSEGACTSAIKLASEACTPNATHIYPLFLDDGSEAGLAIRELRLHPDNLHITWNSFSVSTTGLLDEFTGISRLTRYELVNTTILRNPDHPHPLSVAGERRDARPQPFRPPRGRAARLVRHGEGGHVRGIPRRVLQH